MNINFAFFFEERTKIKILFWDLPNFKKLGIAVIHGEAKEDEEENDGRASPPPPTLSNRVTSVGTVLPPLMCKEKPPISVVGDVGGRIAIMVCYDLMNFDR